MKIDFEKVLADYGLKVGDSIKITFHDGTCEILEIRKIGNDILFRNYKKLDLTFRDICYLEFEKVEPKKKVGDLNCEEVANDMEKMKCSGCPLKCLSCENGGPTLNDIAKETFKKFPQLEPMRAYIEKELNKEVEVNE